jgi:phosphohistidine phosphatase
MNLYVLRHASAGTRRANPVLDKKRPLDKEGKQQCLQVGRLLSAQRVQFDLVVSSPLKRALQSASLVSTETGYEGGIRLSEALSPAATVAQFRQMLLELEGLETVLVVGHNPNLELFLSSLVSPDGKASLRLRKGSIARVELTRRQGTLAWLLDPRTLRALYASVTKSSRPKTSKK